MKYFILLLVVISSITTDATKIDIGKYTLEVDKVINRKTVWTTGSSVTAKSNFKYVGLKAIFTPKDKKNNRLDIEDFTIRNNGEEYEMTIPQKQHIFYSGANMIKVRKAKKKIIIAVVPKDFKSGDLYYLDTKLGTIVCDNEKGGTFKIE